KLTKTARSGGRLCRLAAWSWRRKVVLPARRMPMTACTLPGTAGSWASRRVNGGGSFAVSVELSFSSRTGCRGITGRMSDQVSVCQGHLRPDPDFWQGHLGLSDSQSGEGGLELP